MDINGTRDSDHPDPAPRQRHGVGLRQRLGRVTGCDHCPPLDQIDWGTLQADCDFGLDGIAIARMMNAMGVMSSSASASPPSAFLQRPRLHAC